MPRYDLIAEGKDAVASLDLETGSNRQIIVGRHPQTDIVIDDERASRRHCAIALTNDGKLIVRDLKSHNGTKVNGKKIAETSLQDGDTITIGRTSFVVRVDRSHQPNPNDHAAPQPPDHADRPHKRGRGLRAKLAERRPNPPDDPSADIPLEQSDDSSNQKQTKAASLNAPVFDDVDTELLQGHPPRSAPHPAKRGQQAPTQTPDAARDWQKRLTKTTRSLPPSSDELPIIVLINADGRPSAAFEGDGKGAIAARLTLMCAGKARATDVHIEPRRDTVAIRMRIDGAMVHIADLPLDVGGLTLRLIKTACQFKHGPRDAVLDGHFSAQYEGRRVDYRASFTPTVHGTKLVIRLLDGANAPSKLADLDLPLAAHNRIRSICSQDTGLLLVAGPTGSGKTTTLYNAIREIDRDRRNVITIEDPVEYYIDAVTQIPVAEETSFGNILRSVLRQDPDVILVGEIRDQETARTAMQAAMTGHVVFSTVHAKDTIGSVFRLIDLGVENYLVANSLDIVLAQRLVRLLCTSCRRQVPITPGQATRTGKWLEGMAHTYTATGCAKCLRTGYFGRQGIYEMLDFKDNDALRDLILTTPSIQAMKKNIQQGVFQNLQQAGWSLVAKGLTSMEEIERVTG